MQSGLRKFEFFKALIASLTSSEFNTSKLYKR